MKIDAEAQGLSDHILAAVRGNRVEAVIAELDAKPHGAEVVSRAILLSAVNWGGAYHDRMQAILAALLQVALTREHVEAQRKMSRAASWLAGAALVFSVLQVVALAHLSPSFINKEDSPAGHSRTHIIHN